MKRDRVIVTMLNWVLSEAKQDLVDLGIQNNYYFHGDAGVTCS